MGRRQNPFAIAPKQPVAEFNGFLFLSLRNCMIAGMAARPIFPKALEAAIAFPLLLVVEQLDKSRNGRRCCGADVFQGMSSGVSNRDLLIVEQIREERHDSLRFTADLPNRQSGSAPYFSIFVLEL